MEATHMSANQAGRKLESMLMMHDMVCQNENRWQYIKTLSNLLRQIDPKRYAKLERMGAL
jgi:hypothetical protein